MKVTINIEITDPIRDIAYYEKKGFSSEMIRKEYYNAVELLAEQCVDSRLDYEINVEVIDEDGD